MIIHYRNFQVILPIITSNSRNLHKNNVNTSFKNNGPEIFHWSSTTLFAEVETYVALNVLDLVM